jgi:hypothetical protein
MVQIFNRRDPEVTANALSKSLPTFIDIYKGVTTPQILEESYHDIRNKKSDPLPKVLSRREFEELKRENELRNRTTSPKIEKRVDDTIVDNMEDIVETEMPETKEVPLKVQTKIPSDYLVKDYTETQLVEKSPKFIPEKIATISNEEKPKIKKGIELRKCFDVGLSVEDTMKKMVELGAPTSKLWVEECFKKYANG